MEMKTDSLKIWNYFTSTATL